MNRIQSKPQSQVAFGSYFTRQVLREIVGTSNVAQKVAEGIADLVKPTKFPHIMEYPDGKNILFERFRTDPYHTYSSPVTIEAQVGHTFPDPHIFGKGQFRATIGRIEGYRHDPKLFLDSIVSETKDALQRVKDQYLHPSNPEEQALADKNFMNHLELISKPGKILDQEEQAAKFAAEKKDLFPFA